MSITAFGMQFDHDYRGRLMRNPGSVPNEVIPLSNKLGVVIHYGGGATNWSLGALAIWQSYARYHCQVGRFAPGVAADGLAYHMGPSFDGEKCLLFDPRVTRWHAGSTHHNRFYLAFNCPIGGQQDASYAMKVAMDEMIHDAMRAGVGKDVQTVIGHMEASSTSCPGVMQTSFVRALRAGTRFAKTTPPTPPVQEVLPPVADHVIIDVPGGKKFYIIQNIYKRWAMVNEHLFIWGYPIDGMVGNDTAGYVQNFERHRFEWTVGNRAAPHGVMLGRVGAELAEKRYTDAYRNKKQQFEPVPSFTDSATHRYISATGMPLSHGFKAFWEAFGGVAIFGYPISQEFRENDLTVQYFERARFEHVPDSPYHAMYHNVALGRVNAEIHGV
jgi:hypothetical protein